LGNNSLTGSIPKSIAKLPLLEELYLQGNQLTGMIYYLDYNNLIF